MEAASRLRPRLRQESSSVHELQRLRPFGEAYLMRNFGDRIDLADAEDAVSDVTLRLHRQIAGGRQRREHPRHCRRFDGAAKPRAEGKLDLHVRLAREKARPLGATRGHGRERCRQQRLLLPLHHHALEAEGAALAREPVADAAGRAGDTVTYAKKVKRAQALITRAVALADQQKSTP